MSNIDLNKAKPELDCYRTTVTESDIKNSFIEDGCVYSSDGKRLLKYEGLNGDITVSLLPVVTICDNAFNNAFLERIVLPESLEMIGVDSLPHCDIELNSPYFLIDEGVLMTSDKKRIIKNINYKKAIYNIPAEVCHIDEKAFAWFGESAAPYYFRITNPYINCFDTNSATIIVSNEITKAQLISSKFDVEFIVGDVYQDEMGVIYTFDKKTLLCYPRELPHSVYEILSECENIAQFAFKGFEDPDDDGSVFRYGNSLRALMLPKHLKSIESYSLSGLYYLKVIIYNQAEDKHVKDLLAKNEHWDIKRVLSNAIYVPIYYSSKK